MRKFRKLTIDMIGAVLLNIVLYSCNNDDLVESEAPKGPPKIAASNSGLHVQVINNGLIWAEIV